MTYAIFPSAGGGSILTVSTVALWFETLALMGAGPGFPVKAFAWNVEPDAPYLFKPADGTPVDGWTSVAPTGGTAGRWLLQSDRISIAPLNIPDEWPRVQLATNACGPKGVDVELRGGRWSIVTPLLFANATPCVVKVSSAAILASAIVPGGVPPANYFKTIFNAHGTPLPATNVGTVNTTPGVGALAVLVDLPVLPIINQFLVLAKNASYQIFRILAVTPGGGTLYTLGVDEPVAFPFVALDTAEIFTSIPQNITIEGEPGALLSGTGNQNIEFMHGERITIRGLAFDLSVGTPVSAGVGLDLGCRDSTLEDLKIDFTGGGAGLTGAYAQSSVRGRLVALRVSGMDIGIQILDSYSTGSESSWAFNCARGIILGSLTGPASLGNFDCWVNGGGAIGCGIGLNIFGSTDITVTNFSARGCSVNGVQIEVAAGPVTTRTRLVNVSSIGNLRGVFNGAGVLDTRCEKLDVSANTGDAVRSDEGIEIADIIARALPTAAQRAILLQGANKASKITDAEISMTGAGAVAIDSTHDLRLKRGNISAQGNNSTGILVRAGAVAYLEDVVITGGVGSKGLDIDVQGAVIIGPGCDFSGCAVPVTNTGTWLDVTEHAQVEDTLAIDAVAPVAYGDLLTVNISVQFGRNSLRISSTICALMGANFADFQYLLDGVALVPPSGFTFGGLAAHQNGGRAIIVPALSPGLHVVKVQWQCLLGAQIRALTQPAYESASLIVQEVSP